MIFLEIVSDKFGGGVFSNFLEDVELLTICQTNNKLRKIFAADLQRRFLN